jgi:hypothetical protein
MKTASFYAETKTAIAFDLVAFGKDAGSYVDYVIHCLIPALMQQIDDYGDDIIQTPMGSYTILQAKEMALPIARELDRGMVAA